MEQEELNLHHQQLLEKNLALIGDGLSEYCFPNLYLFRHIHQYRVVFDEKLFISGKTYDGYSFLMPAFDPRELETQYARKIISDYDFFFPISKPMLRHFDKEVFSAQCNPDDSDYIYTAEKLKFYRGRQLSAKRNLMKQFLEKFTPRTLPLTSQRRGDAENILDQWLSDVAKTIEETDYLSCYNAICRLESLDLGGTIYYADEEPAGFLVFCEATPKICVFLFAKGKRKFKGVFQYMFNQFANTHPDQFTAYNFEQDLGKPNFRKTKLSYIPDRMLAKYRVRADLKMAKSLFSAPTGDVSI